MGRKMKYSGVEWIGEIPEEWRLIRGKYILKLRQELPKSTDEIITCFRDGEVTLRRNRREDGFTMSDKEIGYQHINKGDLVIHGMDGFAGAIGVSDSDGKASPVLVVCESNQNKKFLMYYLRKLAYQNVFISLSTGIRVRSCDLRWNKISDLLFTIPSIDEQNKIVNFLDDNLGDIERLIGKIGLDIESYKQLKQSVITQAVTKGVRGQRPMKDSGIEWIGDIPENWNICRVKDVFQLRNERNDKPLSEVNLISLYTDLGVVQHSDLENTTGNKASNADGYKLVYPDDIVVNIILCWMGAIGRSKFEGVTSPAYDIYKPCSKINCRYYHYYFRTSGFSGDCYKVGRGIMAMRWRTYSSEFRAINIPCPSKEEQTEIADYLDQKCSAIDTLIVKKERLLADLEAYKKSLIYECVTGKREVS